MKYLSPEIEAWSKNENVKSLVRPGVSCGIFQDCDSNEKPQTQKHQHPEKQKPKEKKL